MKNKITATVIMCAILTSSIGISTRADNDDSWLMGFAQCNSQLNIRKSPDVNSDIIGLLNNNDLVYVESTDEYGWSKIFSGEIEGYVAAEYIATGEAADKIAAETGYTTAEIGAAALNIRQEPNSDSAIVSIATQSDCLEVVEDRGDWVKVCLDTDTYGWINTQYAYLNKYYPTAEPIEDTYSIPYVEYDDIESESEPIMTYDELYQSGYSEDEIKNFEENVETFETPEILIEETNESSENKIYNYDEGYYYEENQDGDFEYYDLNENLLTTQSYQDYYGLTQTDETITQNSNETGGNAKDLDETTAETDPLQIETSYQEETTAETSYQEETNSIVSSGSYDVVSYAQQFVGNPYVWGGSSLTNGADCSGFTMSVYAHFGISLPHNAAAQSGCGTSVSLDSIQAGDLLFYSDGSGISHVAIYNGDGTVTHASNSNTGITISSYNYRNPVAAVRLL